jgi:hypothetical protein
LFRADIFRELQLIQARDRFSIARTAKKYVRDQLFRTIV